MPNQYSPNQPGSGVKNNNVDNTDGNSEAQYETQCQIEKCRVT